MFTPALTQTFSAAAQMEGEGKHVLLGAPLLVNNRSPLPVNRIGEKEN